MLMGQYYNNFVRTLSHDRTEKCAKPLILEQFDSMRREQFIELNHLSRLHWPDTPLPGSTEVPHSSRKLQP